MLVVQICWQIVHYIYMGNPGLGSYYNFIHYNIGHFIYPLVGYIQYIKCKDIMVHMCVCVL